MDEMDKPAAGSPAWQSRVVTLVVEQGKDGMARIVLEGPYMGSTGFLPGDRVDAVVQPELISILNVE